MSTDQNKPAKDKIHPPELGETQDFEELSFNKEKNTFLRKGRLFHRYF
jgi:hypothetical protein